MTKTKLKRAITAMAYYSGLMDIFIKVLYRNKTIVLMYHRVVDDEEYDPSSIQAPITVTKSSFQMQLKVLKKYFNIIDVKDFDNYLTNKRSINRKCLLTFDDGWIDNSAIALPAMVQEQCSAIIFITADYIGKSNIFWQERLYLLIQHIRKMGDKSRLGCINDVYLEKTLLCSDEKLFDCMFLLISDLKKKGLEAINRLLSDLEEKTSYTECHNTRRFMDWDQVSMLNENGMKIGSHGCSHAILTNEKVDLKNEIYLSKEIIETHLKKKIDCFSYPNGNYNAHIINLLRDAKYKSGFTTIPGYISNFNNSFEIKRVNINEANSNTVPTFLARLLFYH